MVVRLSCSFVNVAVENYFRKSSLHRQSFVKSPFSNSKFPFVFKGVQIHCEDTMYKNMH